MAKFKKRIGSITDMGGNKYRLRISVTDDYGKRHQPSKVVHASGKREANKLLMDFYNWFDLSTYNSDKPFSLTDLYNEWMKNHCEKTLNNGTINNYRSYWDRFLSDKGNIQLCKIKPYHIYEILSSCNIPENSRTQKALFDMLSSMFNRAVKWGYMPSNPCSFVDAPNYKAKEKQPLTRENIADVMAALPKEETKYRVMFIFAAVLGMRRQEIVALKWSDIDFKNRTISITRAAEPLRGHGTSIKETKNDSSERILFLPDVLIPILKELKSEQDTIKDKLRELYIDEDWIFTQWNGKIMNIHTPTNWWRKFSNKLGIHNVTFHGLRHTAASFMIMNNVPITTVSSVLGHADVTTTLKVYSHVIEDTKATAIKSMEQVILDNKPKN